MYRCVAVELVYSPILDDMCFTFRGYKIAQPEPLQNQITKLVHLFFEMHSDGKI